MSGLVKAKKYCWKDSNLALFGSDLERQVKKESAQTEPAWEGAGSKVGVQVWRIVKFEVTHWPEEDYGSFYNGDSYIVLNTYTVDDSEDLKYDVHFWIGKDSSQDEYGTAAYKTVELDTLLDDKAVQHREVQGRESDLFKSYFEKLIILEGGAETGFRHVQPENYRPRLLRFVGSKKNIEMMEVPKHPSCLNDCDVFILDKGDVIYQMNTPDSNKDERFKALQFLQGLKSERGSVEVETLEQADTRSSHDFYESLTDEEPTDVDAPIEEIEKTLYRYTDKEFQEVKVGEFSKADLATDDVFLVYNGKNAIVWVGETASPSEKKNGIPYAHTFLNCAGNPQCPITVTKEGLKCPDLDVALCA
ncbi:gelsolin 2 [Octopus vulgaris]|uniref:Actin-modulator n=1 Tax=Octopus vulgaris TaxID=6645 RepID=A0AA36AVP3_OCTVU|nr:gelsolin 2 [Octopus vulgaris]